MNWLPLALATAVAFGAYNVFIKMGSAKIDQVLGAVVLQVVAALLGGAYAIYLKLAGRAFTVSSEGLLFAALAGAAVGLAEILTFFVFSRGAPAAMATPVIMGGSVIAAALIGILFLKEGVNFSQAAGILLVAAGIALVSRGLGH